MASRKAEKERLRQERLARERELAAAARRRKLFQIYGSGAVAVIAVIVIVVVVLASGGGSSNSTVSRNHPSHPVITTGSNVGLDLKPAPNPGPLGPEGIPIPKAPPLASNATSARGGAVDGIQCFGNEQTLFHVHTHLSIFVNGAPRQVPYGIGIVPPRQVTQTKNGPFVESGTCFYWLHTHSPDGIIHIESPVVRTFTLGNFFDIWGQPLGPNQLGPVKGKVTAFYNGKLYKADPRDIPLGNHVQITLNVGTPLIGPQNVNFNGSGL